MLTPISSANSFMTFFSEQVAANSALTSQSLQISQDASQKRDPVQTVLSVMAQRNQLGYGIGYSLRGLLGTDSEPVKRSIEVNAANDTVPLTDVYEDLFPQETLNVLYIELDPGVDDTAALIQLLAAAKNTPKRINIVGIVPCVGNAILPQTEQNTMQILELTGSQNIPVYPGAVAPLAIEQNQTAINAMNQAINATHFYGYDGEEDVGGWPPVTMKLQTTPGYQYAANLISTASTDAPLTLVSTSALTELSKTLSLLESLDVQKGVLPGTFVQKINAISIMGGCVNPAQVNCNAPFNVPDNQKNSEANFYFDSPAAANVFAICQKYAIPILLAPLDLTQLPGILWTKKQVQMVNQTGNAVGMQMARVTNVVPYIDALHFPNGTYPMHDLQAVTPLLVPECYNVTRLSVTIGDVGQMIINPNASESQKMSTFSGCPHNSNRFFTRKFCRCIAPSTHQKI